MTFGNKASGNTTVHAKSPVDLNQVTFTDPASYAIGSHGPLNLTAGGGATVTILSSSGNHQNQVPVNAQVDTTVDVSDGSSLDINGELSLNGNTLTKDDTETLSISNVNSGGGPLVIAEGTIAENGTVDDLVNLGKTISPGGQAVPEPTSVFLIGSDMLLMGMCGIRRGK